MDFLGVGPLELIFVLIIAILVIGPRDISKTAKTVGRFLNRMYKSDEWRALTEASRTLKTLPNRLAREAELEELNEIKETIRETSDELNATRGQMTKESAVKAPNVAQPQHPDADAMKAWTTPPDESLVEDEPSGEPSADQDDRPSEGS